MLIKNHLQFHFSFLGEKKLKKPTHKLACQFEIFKPFNKKNGQRILGYDKLLLATGTVDNRVRGILMDPIPAETGTKTL